MISVSPSIGGDGGPIILLQHSVAARWNVDQPIPILAGGSEFTDYDAICEPGDGIHVISRYDRDLIVMSDSSWTTCAVGSERGITLVQIIGSDRSPEEIATEVRTRPPDEELNFDNRDGQLVLMVGATTLVDSTYPQFQTTLEPGPYVVRAHYIDEAYVAELRPRPKG